MTQMKYGPIGTHVFFENDRVRVWEIELTPGETLPMHFHELDYVVVTVSGGTTTVEWEDGRRETNDQQPGDIIWREARYAHALINNGADTYRNRLIELKR